MTAEEKAILASTIKSATISLPTRWGEMAKVDVVLESGEKVRAFEYYSDELHFSESEFVGKTVAQANELWHQKNVRSIRGF